jgi:hypothetical protein
MGSNLFRGKPLVPLARNGFESVSILKLHDIASDM